MKAISAAARRSLLVLPFLLACLKSEAQSPVSFSLPANAPQPALIRAEYYFDTDPGYGQGNSLPLGTAATALSSSYMLNIASLGNGAHQLYTRVKDAAGNWSFTVSNTPVVVYQPFAGMPASASVSQITKAEYFVDNDPGIGAGTAIPVTPGDSVTNVNTAVALTGLPNGLHNVYVRVRNSAGSWSLTNSKPFSILLVSTIGIPATPAPAPFTQLEYFIDTDPGLGNGTIVNVPAGVNLNNYPLAVNVSGLSTGSHTVYVRTVNPWSFAAAHSFSIGAPLPVEWLSFSARREGESVELSWQTARERENRSYTVERSADGSSFSAIGSLPAGEAGAQRHSYSLRDEAPLRGASYYRIRQEDADGRQNYSAIVKVYLEPGALLSVNNPVRNELVIRSTADKGIAGTALCITDAAGRRVMQLTTSGDALQRVGMGELSPGTYFLQFLQDGQLQSIRFLKQ